jgi:hypothetical protein
MHLPLLLFLYIENVHTSRYCSFMGIISWADIPTTISLCFNLSKNKLKNCSPESGVVFGQELIYETFLCSYKVSLKFDKVVLKNKCRFRCKECQKVCLKSGQICAKTECRFTCKKLLDAYTSWHASCMIRTLLAIGILIPLVVQSFVTPSGLRE